MFVTKSLGRRTKLSKINTSKSVFHKRFKNNLLPASSFEFLLKGFVLIEAIIKERGQEKAEKKNKIIFIVQLFSRGLICGNAVFKGQGRKAVEIETFVCPWKGY